MIAKRELRRPRLCVIGTVILFALLTLACPNRSGDRLTHAHLIEFAGDSATDCGHVALGQEFNTANSCVLGAFQEKHSFIVRYDVQGRDSRLVVGLAANDQGRVVIVKYDSEGWDPHQLQSDDRLADNGHVLLKPCPAESKLHKTQTGYLSCFDY